MNGQAELAPLNVAARRADIERAVAAADIDVLIVSTPSNIRWASGFTGSNGMLFVTSGGWVLHSDTRYETQAPSQLEAAGADVEVVIGRDPWVEVANQFGAKRVGVEANHLTWSAVNALVEATGTDDVVATTELIDGLRAHKDAAELERIQMAARIVDQALASVLPQIRVGITEIEVARRLDDEIRTLGATGPAYDTIVAGGPNSALPHATPGHRPLEAGDLLVIDVGAEVDGYRSDMTRTFVLGEPTQDRQRQLDTVLVAQAAGLAAVAPGATGADVDGAARDIIEAAGWGDAFGHGTGHGVGLDIHELPRVNSRADDQILGTNMVVTVEPGVYLPGEGGVRWEDLVVVTDAGFEFITGSPKDPVLTV